MMRFPTAVLFLHLLVLVGATITDPSQWTGLNNLPTCVQNVFGDCSNDCSNGGGCIPCHVGCGDWACACNQFSAVISAASSVAATECSTSQADVAYVTSIVDGFCEQLLALSAGPTAPTSAPTSTVVPRASFPSIADTSIDDGAASKSGGSGGLSQTDKIAIGVGIGVGLPAVVAAIWQMWIWFNTGD